MGINIFDTIVAPATNLSMQAISIIRVSGEDAFKIINKLFKKDIEIINKPQLRKVYINNNLIDEVLALPFISPNSFTGENIVELNCHGGIFVTKLIIENLILNGARLAKRGEFSERAYVNNKISLIQAQGINDLIEAKNLQSVQINALNMSGKTNESINKIKDEVMDLISRIQTSIDYPDYDDIEGSTIPELKTKIFNLMELIKKIVDKSKRASLLQNGIKVLILGKTNVGKSSILNSLINEDKAIVSNIEGTTRDIVEGEINLENHTLKIIDTAGIRETIDVVENLGIEKSKKLIYQSDLILFVTTNKINEDNELYKLIKDRKHIIVVNKKDLIDEDELNFLKSNYNNIALTSAINDDVSEIINEIKKLFDNNDLLVNNEPILTNIDQITKLELMLSKVKNAFESINNNIPIDIVNIDLYEINDLLNDLLGKENYEEEILDLIFRKYCLGK